MRVSATAGTRSPGDAEAGSRRPRRTPSRVELRRLLALLPALALALAMTFAANLDDRAPVFEVSDAPATVTGLPTLVEAPPVATPAAEPSAAPTAEASAAPGATPAAPVIAPPRPVESVRLHIPVLGVNAPVVRMGLDANGVMEVPYDPATVAWYGFSAAPGSEGNAVMAGHVDWGGSRAVFYGLRTLQAGDVIEVSTPEVTLTYTVQTAYLVRPEEANLAEIIGERRGPETLTLITCGGTFDRSIRQYDHRVIVRAVRT